MLNPILRDFLWLEIGHLFKTGGLLHSVGLKITMIHTKTIRYRMISKIKTGIV